MEFSNLEMGLALASIVFVIVCAILTLFPSPDRADPDSPPSEKDTPPKK